MTTVYIVSKTPNSRPLAWFASYQGANDYVAKWLDGNGVVTERPLWP